MNRKILKFKLQFWAWYLGTRGALHVFIADHYQKYSLPFSLLNVEELTNNTSGSFVDTLSNTEMREREEIRGHSFFLRKSFFFPNILARMVAMTCDLS